MKEIFIVINNIHDKELMIREKVQAVFNSYNLAKNYAKKELEDYEIISAFINEPESLTIIEEESNE